MVCKQCILYLCMNTDKYGVYLNGNKNSSVCSKDTITKYHLLFYFMFATNMIDYCIYIDENRDTKETISTSYQSIMFIEHNY